MIINPKRFLFMISSFLLFGLIWPSSPLSKFDAAELGTNVFRPNLVIASLSFRTGNLSDPAVFPKTQMKPDKSVAAPKPRAKNGILENEVSVPKDLKEILGNYYEDSDIYQQEKAFKRVIGWKKDFEDISKKYQYVDWKILASIVKAETQGKTGRQISNAGAIGLSQIKYQGAWAFLWDALFSERIKNGSAYVRDYYNEGIRARYNGQLQQIRRYLEDKDILVKPQVQSENAYRNARSQSWNNLKTYLLKKYRQGEYQVAVDISAMYIDHLIFTFLNVQKQVLEIKQQIEKKDFDSLNVVKFSGTKGARWNRIKEHLTKQAGLGDSPELRESTLKHLNDILDRLGNPNIFSAAYNFGVSKVLEHTESGKELPEGIVSYVKKIVTYHTIFDEMERFSLFT